jgi:hypothetical protein
MRRQFGGIITSFLWNIRNGKPIDFEGLKDIAASIDPSSSYEIILDVDREFLEEQDKIIEGALKLFEEHLPSALAGIAEQHYAETIFRALREYSGRGSYVFQASESELIKELIKHLNRWAKRRLDARPPGGSELTWTTERAEALLLYYESGKERLRDAKTLYKQNKHRKNWEAVIKTAHPELPESIISSLASPGKNSEPNYLALVYAARVLEVKPGEYLKKVLTRARHTRKEKSGQ